MGADEELGGSCVVGGGAEPGFCRCGVVPAGGAGCVVVEGGGVCVGFCASAADGDAASSDTATSDAAKPARGLKLLKTSRSPELLNARRNARAASIP
jgi:hypothetical protein